MWRQSTTAAGLAALAYAFSAPVLFQYCNIIYLVGAAWVPWGFLAIEVMLSRHRRAGLLGLAVVLALQVLGGDPEAAYLTVLCGAGYALVLAAWDRPEPATRRAYRRYAWCGAALFAWAGLTLGLAWAAPRTAPPRWLPPATVLRVLAWTVASLLVVWRWFRRQPDARLEPMLASLAGASALAVVLTAAQLLPALEYAATTLRAAGDQAGQDYGFSIEPYRLIEAAWPDAYGRFGPANQSWIQSLPPAAQRQFWSPSLYLGGLTLVLALGGFGFGSGSGSGPRAGPPWRAWLSLIAVVAVAASLGRFGGPLWVVRWLPGVKSVLGPHDPGIGVPRVDSFLDDGAGSVYGMLAASLPGFTLFRYPGKLFTFAAVAVSALAGLGWDRLAEGATRAPRRGSLAGLIATLAVLALVLAEFRPIVAWLHGHLPADVEFGKVEPSAALGATVGGLVHGALVFAAGLVLTMHAPRRPRRAGVLALAVMALDLGVANAPLVWTVPEADFATMPRAAALIAAAESAGSPGPFRFHRMEMAFPAETLRGPPAGKLRAVAAWERNTLAPVYGLPLGFDYTYVQGLLESDSYAAFFGSRVVVPRDSAGTAAGPPVYSFPRRGFDLWNTRYLMMDVSSNGWIGAEAGFERLYPPPEIAADPGQSTRWIAGQNWQLLRNLIALPRAWLVHDVRVRTPIAGRSDPGYYELMQDLVYQANSLWSIPGRPLLDPRTTAVVETDQPQGLTGYVPRMSVRPGESVVIASHEPQRVELMAELEHPGLVILADTHYPGWSLTIDGAPAPIYRTNRLMRGAAVKAGRHMLVYTYDPASFRIGGAITIAGLLTLAVLVPWVRPKTTEDQARRSTRPRRGSAP